MPVKATGREMAMDYTHVIYEQLGTIAIITMNRHERLNAMGREGGRELQHALLTAEQDPEIRVIILTGGNSRAFSVGADLKDTATHASESVVESLGMFTTWGSSVIETLRKPIIAAVNGYCVGGGFEQALACDIIISSDTATFWFPQTGLGLFPGNGGSARLSRTVGKHLAMAIVLTGKRIDAQEAYRIGLVSQVVPASELRESALGLATTIAEKAPLGVMFAKQSILRAEELPLRDALAEDGMRLFPLYATQDRKEASTAFLERRQPIFRGQ
jgi:enoyl-CoA hydratase/carnithine racemase